MSHYKLKANIDGSEVIAESLELTGSKAFKVFPDSRNETETPIRGSAVVSILGKNHSIQLNHKIKTYEDPEPSTTKWSYITDLYLTGDTPVPDADIKLQDTGYVRASCGKTTYNNSGNTTQKIIISKQYTTYNNLLDTVGDFSGTHYGTEYNRDMQYMTLFSFTMYYKYATIDGTTVIPPTDDGTPASNKARIPCRPDISGAPDWITNSGIGYVIDYKTSAGATPVRRFFRVWSDFITFWDSIQTDPEYYDATFFYIWEGQVQFNGLLNQRGSNTVTVSEIDNGKGVGIHGAKPVYLIISQQEGFIKYHAAAVPCETSMQDNDGYWWWNKYEGYQLDQYRLPESDSQNDYYRGAISYTPKFRIANNTSGRVPGNICEPNRDNKAIMDFGNGEGVKYVYTGQAFIFALYNDTPFGKEAIPFKPYFNGENKLNHNSSIDIIGQQCYNDFRTDGQQDGKYKVFLREDKTIFGWLSGPVEGGNKGWILFQLLPVALFGINPNTGSRYVHTVKDPVLMNHSIRYLNYMSAVTQQEINEGHYAPYTNWKGSVAEPRSQATLFGETWEGTYSKSENLKNIESVLLLPVLYTNYIIEGDHTYFGPGGAAHSHTCMGRLWFSPGIDDNQLTESVIRQMHIGIPSFQYQ